MTDLAQTIGKWTCIAILLLGLVQCANQQAKDADAYKLMCLEKGGTMNWNGVWCNLPEKGEME